MEDLSRRAFLATGTWGVLALGSGCAKLGPEAGPTEPSGDLGTYGRRLKESRPKAAAAKKPDDWAITEDNILGPYHRARAPYRAKITPPLEPGKVLLVRGQAWGFDTRKPLAGAVIDIWQANATGRYDNDDPNSPPKKDVFVNRARIVTDENGAYEFETIYPGPYRIGPRSWRPPHIHYWVRADGYKELVTQLYFRGSPHQATDPFIKDSLIIDLKTVQVGGGTYKSGAFDIVLPAKE